MLSFIAAGIILGLSAGLAPGPLLTLVISETLQHDMKSGIRVALAPVLTDLPIILFTVFILAKLAGFQIVLGLISIAGACFVSYLGIVNLKTRGVNLMENPGAPRSLRKGFFTNLLSPHPYLFWITVGGPTTVKAMALGISSAAAFVLSFYALLIGSKIGLAFLVGKSRAFLRGGKYLVVLRLLGALLIILGLILLRDGLHLLGAI